MRVTKKQLKTMIDILNRQSKESYDLDIAYGGYRLAKNCKSGGCSFVSMRLTAKEMYYVLDALINYGYKENVRSDDD